jgi:iron complex outermembrane receptor protein
MKFRTFGVVSALALSAALAVPAYAQDEAADQADEGARNTDIIVTAEFRERALQETPIAITAVNAEMLEARGQTDIAQVAAQAPNVVLRPQPQNSGIGLVAFIRGIGQTDFNYALEPGVGVYIDDVYIPTLSSSLLDLMDLDRIEVLRGPQGTLAGKNSIGGAIKLFSSKPDGSGRGSLQATYGSYNRIDVRGFFDFEVTENLFARVAGVSKNRDGYVTLLDYGLTHSGTNVPTNNNAGKGGVLGTLGGQNYAAGKISLRWVPVDTIELNISGDVTNEDSDSGPEVLLATNPAFTGDTAPLAGSPWLVGTDGNPVNVGCQFVPQHGYHGNFANASCDTTPSGYDPRYISYANFLDNRAPTGLQPYKPYAAIPGNKYEGWGIHANFTADLMESLQFVAIGSWREYDSTWGMDQDGTPVPVAQLNQTLHHRAWSLEGRLNGDFADGMFEYTLGGFYFDQDGSLQARVDLNYAVGGLGIDFIHGPDTTPSTSKAVFFNGTVRPTDELTISGGIRRSWDKKTYTYFRSNPDGTVPDPVACPNPFAGPNCALAGLYDISDTFKGSRWDWRIAANYQFTPDVMVYASVATGYKGGGVNPRPFFGPGPLNQLANFNPETLTTYEVGFKTDFADNRVRLNGALFYNKYKDIILTLLACPTAPCLQPNNVGDATVKGAELEAAIFPVDGLSIDGSLSYLDFKYTGPFSAPTAGDCTDRLSGTNVTRCMVTPYTPEWTYSFGIQYDWELEPGTVAIRFDGSYQSAMETAAINTPTSHLPGRFLANGRLSYTTADDDWQVSLEVQNLFNKYYMHTVSDIYDPGVLGVWTGAPGLPRTWAVTIKRNFGGN